MGASTGLNIDEVLDDIVFGGGRRAKNVMKTEKKLKNGIVKYESSTADLLGKEKDRKRLRSGELVEHRGGELVEHRSGELVAHSANIRGTIAAEQTPDSWLEKARKRKAKGEEAGQLTASVLIKTPRTAERGIIRVQKVDYAESFFGHERSCSSVGSVTGARRENGEIFWSTGLDGAVNIYECKLSSCWEADGMTATSFRSREQLVTLNKVKLSGRVSKRIVSSCLDAERNKVICVMEKDPQLVFVDVETGKKMIRCEPIAHASLWNEGGNTGFKQIVSQGRTVCLLDDRGRIHHIDDRTLRSSRVYNSATLATCMTFIGGEEIGKPRRLVSGDICGEIFEWDLGVGGRCLNRVKNEGVLEVTSLASTANFLVAGTKSGFVNLFDAADLSRKIREFGNLVNPVTVAAAHSRAPLSLVSCAEFEGACRLLHTGSATDGFVYQNWPIGNKVGKVSAAAFSHEAGLLMTGTTGGVVRVWSMPDLASSLDQSNFA